MVDLVSMKKILIKSTKSKLRQAALRGLRELCQEVLCIIKNKLMFVYKKFPLPSKAVDYVPHINKEFKEFPMANFITNNVLQSWLNRLVKDPGGKTYFVKRGSNLNKSTKVEDIAPLL